MPLLEAQDPTISDQDAAPPPITRQQSQHSGLARSALMSNASGSRRPVDGASESLANNRNGLSSADGHANGASLRPLPTARQTAMVSFSDTPTPTAPPSPSILPKGTPKRQDSGDSISRARATTLDIPGLTKSRVSPDGKISQRDVGSKLVIVMVGLPARGKSYITKKIARYLNWLQHDTKIFNVGERRRVAAGGNLAKGSSDTMRDSVQAIRKSLEPSQATSNGVDRTKVSEEAARVLMSDEQSVTSQNPPAENPKVQHARGGSVGAQTLPELRLPEASENKTPPQHTETMEQSASFFDPNNRKASLIREQAALEALDDLLDYILEQGGSVGVLDATNSTLERRKLIMRHVRDRAGPDLNVLFLESLCVDQELLESNMRLKLSGPDYKGKDPEASLADFRKRVEIYERAYVPLGEYEEKNDMPYIQMIDVGRKVISHQINGFLSSQAVYYLLNFNLAPRQIWITRHGESWDNIDGKIGGDAELSPLGHRFAQALSRFIDCQRKEWEIHQQEKIESSHLPPQPGDHTPPNPHYEHGGAKSLHKNFCVWTSMLKRSIQTAEYFDEEAFDAKQMRMLNELFAGYLEGLTYAEIRAQYSEEYESRLTDKLHYRYPGAGGEGYLDVINRVRAVIVELERMKDHCLLISHRSVVRVLLAYFTGLGRDKVMDLDVPIGMLYCLEPKPYGVAMKAFKYNAHEEWFELQQGYELQTTAAHRDQI